MKEVATLLNAMRTAGVIADYALLEAKTVTATCVAEVATRHGLTAAWAQFKRRFLDAP